MRQETIRRLFSLGLTAVVVIIFGVTSEYFLTSNNIFSFLREASVPGIIAVGVTFVIITAGIDLSTGALVAFVCMTAGNLLYYTSLPAWLVALLCILVGALGGILNGLAVTKLKLPDFVATLSSQGIFRGLTMFIAIRTAGRISNKVISNRDFLWFNGNIGGLYFVTIVFFVVAAVGQLILKRTKLGTYTYAAGADRKSADLSGINTNRVKLTAFLLTGLLCGLAGVFMLARTGAATVELGLGLELDVIAAVVVGGCAFSGGRGDIVGTVIGALFMAILTNGIYKYGLGSEYQLVIKGAVIIVMVVFDSIHHRYFEGKILSANRSVGPKGAAQGTRGSVIN